MHENPAQIHESNRLWAAHASRRGAGLAWTLISLIYRQVFATRSEQLSEDGMPLTAGWQLLSITLDPGAYITN